MFFKFLVTGLSLSVLLWYFHEYHTETFMAIAKNIPYLSPWMARLHSRGNQLKSHDVGIVLFTKEELLNFNGAFEDKPIYIAILGEVFDVSKGRKYYGPGGTYNVFAGRDASRSFVTGEFSIDNASDDIIDLSSSDLLSLQDWKDFYQKDYKFIGKLIGRFFNNKGEKTEYYKEVDFKMGKGLEAKSAKLEERNNFPPCNIEWSANKGSRVWCSVKSGGITREWSGVPRKLYEIGSTKYRCSCINLDFLKDPNSVQYSKRFQLGEYEGCEPQNNECFY